MLDSLKLEGFPKNEKDRREAWMNLPRSVRLAIRRLHHNFGPISRKQSCCDCFVQLALAQKCSEERCSFGASSVLSYSAQSG